MRQPKTSSKKMLLLLLTVFVSCFLIYSCTKIEPDKAQAVSAANAALVSTSSKLNVILILADDVGYEVPTVNGGQSYITPNLDRMAAQGVKFDQCRSMPLCSPSRVELMTGKYNFRNYGLWGVLDTSNRTIANVMHDAGYATLATGKWQLGGGDASLHSFGFDDYLVHNPFTRGSGGGERMEEDGILASSNASAQRTIFDSYYKDPYLYLDARFYTAAESKGHYGDDDYVNYLSNFIDENKSKPFFIYYAQSLCHAPFCPTPEDPEYAAWDMSKRVSDTSFFPSMAKYMDEKVGQVIAKVQAAGVAHRTIIIYIADNGTDRLIYSQFKGKRFRGGKSTTIDPGVHVPMYVWCPARLKPSITNRLVDFSDFLPTIADIAGVKVPASYGPIDGVSFYDAVSGDTTGQRQWQFFHYNQNEGGEGRHPIKRWVQDSTYKLYDSTNLFYNIKKDLHEKHPIANTALTPEEKATKTKFTKVLTTMHN